MKKLVMLLITGVMVFSLTACGGSSDATTPSETSKEQQESADADEVENATETAAEATAETDNASDAASAAETESAVGETITITSADGTFTAEIPTDWQEDGPDEDFDLQASKTESDGNLSFFMLITENKEDAGVKFDTWKYILLSASRDEAELATTSDEMELEIDGNPAIQQTITEGVEDGIKVQMTFIDGETYYGCVMCSSTSVDTFNNNENIFNVIVNSVKGF